MRSRTNNPTRRTFLARLQGEIAKRGTVDVLRRGIRHRSANIDLFYGTPSPGNDKAKELFRENRFSVTRQLRYSRDETQRALDIVLFINGLPVLTFELKNRLTKQTVADAVVQYRTDRNPREPLFQRGRCLAHFAVDENEVRFCTHLQGKASWFLPFNRGFNDGAGNPPNPDGLKTDYLWREVLTPASLTNIVENYAQIIETRDEKTGRKKRVQIWPRFQQLDVVRRLLADAGSEGAGKRYLIQHSAGSGKSNSIAWLAHQLIGLRKDDAPVFDSIIVVTDRRILDRQIRDTIRQYAQVGATVGHAVHSGDLRRFIESGKKIIISTVQKFPVTSSTRSAASTGGAASRSSSTKPTRARAVEWPTPWGVRWAIPARNPGRMRPTRTGSTMPDGAHRLLPTPATSRSPRPRRTRPSRYSATPTRSPTGRSGTTPSTATP